jgi:hypothetical protein
MPTLSPLTRQAGLVAAAGDPNDRDQVRRLELRLRKRALMSITPRFVDMPVTFAAFNFRMRPLSDSRRTLS